MEVDINRIEDNNNFCFKLKSSLQRVCYGFGHIYNDLCAAVWFSYILFYFQIILEMETTTSGLLVMIGQVADSVATPVAGWAVDRIGTRRVWHLAGTAGITTGFYLIFSFRPSSRYMWVFYYGISIIIFQIGWAIVQISHLSIIPRIARDNAHSADLTTIRYIASVCCSIIVHIITLVILKSNDVDTKIGPNDYYKFKQISLIIICIGISTTLIFYFGVKWKRNEYELIIETKTNEKNNGVIKHFLKSPVIYKVSLMYMCSRLFTILSLVYIPLYLNEKVNNINISTSEIRKIIASVPLVSFTASLFTSLILKFRTERCTDKIIYVIGSIVSLVGCFLTSISTMTMTKIYMMACLMGIGGSATLIASLCLTAIFVKTNGYNGGIVYSAVTFTDKFISGAIVLIFQHLECEKKELCPNFYEHILTYACGCTAILGLISTFFLQY